MTNEQQLDFLSFTLVLRLNLALINRQYYFEMIRVEIIFLVVFDLIRNIVYKYELEHPWAYRRVQLSLKLQRI